MLQFLISHLPYQNGRLSCIFESNQNFAAKLRRVLVVQCLKTQKHILRFFWPNTQFVFQWSFLFIDAAPGTFGRLLFLSVWATSKTHKKVAKRFSANTKNKKNHFLTIYGTKRKFFATIRPFSLLQNLARPTRCPSHEVHYRHFHTVKIRTVSVQTWKRQEPIFWTFLGPRRNFFWKVQ